MSDLSCQQNHFNFKYLALDRHLFQQCAQERPYKDVRATGITITGVTDAAKGHSYRVQ